MILKGVILATSALSGFENIFSSLEQFGFFSHLLPFLLIFALVFGILAKVNIFGGNKAVNAIIAFVVAIMSLQFSFVSQFFSEIFPRVGIGLIVILCIFILVGLFAPRDSNWINYVLLGIAVIIVIVVLVQTAGSLGFRSGQFFIDNWPTILALVIVIVFIIVIISTTGRRPGTNIPKIIAPIWAERE